MRTNTAGGRKTQSGRPAFGNALEQKIEILLAAMTKCVEDTVACAGQEDGECKRNYMETISRLGHTSASLISAAARLNGEFKHEIQVKHLYESTDEEEDKYASDFNPEVPLFTHAELQTLTPPELMREIPIREAAYWARKASEVTAAMSGIPAPLRDRSRTRPGFVPASHGNDPSAPADDPRAEAVDDTLDAIKFGFDALNAQLKALEDEEPDDEDDGEPQVERKEEKAD